MRMSFDDEESFKEAVESLRFNSSDPNTRQQMGSSNSMPLNDSEWNEDRDNITQVIQLHPDEWEAWAVVVYVYKKFGGVGVLKLLFIITHWQAIPNLNSLRLMGCASGSAAALGGPTGRRGVKIVMPVILKNNYFLANNRDHNCPTCTQENYILFITSQ